MAAATMGAATGLGGLVEESSSPKQIVVAPPGEARTLVEGLDRLISVLIKVLIFRLVGKNYEIRDDHTIDVGAR